jgi:hypothetical protein
MRALILASFTALAITAAAGVTGCSSDTTNISELKVGDCVKLGGTPDRPQATKAACGNPESNFRVVALAAERAQCPSDVDSSYSMHNKTVCLDVDWVIGGCMSIDPQHIKDPFRVDCNDASVPHRQRATQILTDLDPPVSVDQCASGLGYTYSQRRFAVCVEDVSEKHG